MIWIACFMKSLIHSICDNIIIVVFLNRILIFVNFVRSSLVSLSKICSKCSMKNSEKKVYFKIKTTYFFKHSQIKCKFLSISSLQSIRNRRLIKIRKIQNRKIWISTCLRNQFALFLAKTCLKNRFFRHTKWQTFFASNHDLRFRRFFHFRFQITFVAFVSIISVFAIIDSIIYVLINDIFRIVIRWKKWKEWICSEKWLNNELYRLQSINKRRLFVKCLFSWSISLSFRDSISILSFSRCLQSEFTTHKKLNRVKNIFRNCRSILLNAEKLNVMQNIWINNCLKSECYIQMNQQDFQQNSQLFTHDQRNYLWNLQELSIVQKIYCIHVLLNESYTSIIACVQVSMF